MSRRDLHPLPTAAAKKIELATAHLEVEIHDAVLAWYGVARANVTGLRTLTAEQQSELQDLLIEMAVQLGEAEGGEYLNVTSSPRQFVIEVAQLMDAIAAETRERWSCLTRDFHVEGLSPDDQKPECEFHRRLHEALRPIARRLIRDAWSVHEKRLAMECACPVSENGASAQEALSHSPPAKQATRELLAQRVERLRIDRGMSVEQLALDAELDKKTVIGVLRSRRKARPATLKKMADALGVSASELAS
ncbi:MAG: helix-turn-helix transcriptional regulator [Bryobacterales bacterium]|nr:helix-turn-helix transcriptional regulator [Bryobacterales bacterium]